MSSNEWTTRQWILRGLKMSCISEHTLYRWYTKMVGEKAVSKEEFGAVLTEARDAHEVYVQRYVPCYEHTPRKLEEEHGWALTVMGEEKETLLWE